MRLVFFTKSKKFGVEIELKLANKLGNGKTANSSDRRPHEMIKFAGRMYDTWKSTPTITSTMGLRTQRFETLLCESCSGS